MTNVQPPNLFHILYSIPYIFEFSGIKQSCSNTSFPIKLLAANTHENANKFSVSCFDLKPF